jgi:ribosome-binding protein aMBF1 (putative translation factor)
MSAPQTTTFAELLMTSLAAREISRAALAAAVGIDETYLMHMQAGRRTPDARVLYRLGKVLRWTRATKALALDLVGAAKDLRRANQENA